MADSYKIATLKKVLGNDRYNQLVNETFTAEDGSKKIDPEILWNALVYSAGKDYTSTGEYLKQALPQNSQNTSKIDSGIGNQINSDFASVLTKVNGIDVDKVADALSVYGGKADEAIIRTATEINPAIQSEFKRVLGRNASQAEIASIVNKMDLKGFVSSLVPDRGTVGTNGVTLTPGQLLGNQFAKEGFFEDVLKRQGGIENFLKASKPMFDQITLAQNNLKNIGKDLSGDEITNILNSTPEQAKELSASYVKSYREGATNTALEGLPAKQKAVLDELDAALRGSQESFFTKDLQPSIERALSASGKGLRSGSLAEALASQAGKLNTAREGIISPLRSSTALGTTQLGYENTLRGALESGKTLTEATGFINDIFKQDKQNAFSSSEAELNRIFQGEQNAQNQALMLALLGGQAEGPSAWDYFYQYGLPVLGTALGGPLGGAAATGLASMFTKKSGGGGGGTTSSSQYGGSGVA